MPPQRWVSSRGGPGDHPVNSYHLRRNLSQHPVLLKRPLGSDGEVAASLGFAWTCDASGAEMLIAALATPLHQWHNAPASTPTKGVNYDLCSAHSERA